MKFKNDFPLSIPDKNGLYLKPYFALRFTKEVTD